MSKIEKVEHSFDLSNMILYAGSTWDWHKIHYDKKYLDQNKISKPVVDGQIFGALISKQILNHFGRFSRIISMDFKYKNMVFEGESILISSEVSEKSDIKSKDNDIIEVKTSIVCDKRVVIENAFSLVRIINE